MAEQGIEVAGGEGWTAMWAPIKTPAAEIERMQRALQKVLATPQVRDALVKRLSVEPDYLNGQQMAKRQRDELAVW
jgi:tripartite-type tricarboxylate transporter receptor subunit TctC